MKGQTGLLSLLFGFIGFAIAITSHNAATAAGVFSLCAGTLGWLAGKNDHDD